MTQSTTIARRVAPGQRPSARNTNYLTFGILELQQATRFLLAQAGPARSGTALCKIQAINPDYLECVRVWRLGTPDESDGAQPILVAKPAQLRTVAARGGVTYSGYSADGQERTATLGPDSETQRVTPSYLVGDLILVSIVRGRTGVQEVDEAERAPKVDSNGGVESRAWAKVPTP